MTRSWIRTGTGLTCAVVLALSASGCGPSKASRAWSSFHTCLIGPPLEEGENVFYRIREVELAERTPPASGEPWPARCTGHAKELFTSIDGSGKTALLKRLLREQLNCTDENPDTCAFPKDTQPLTKADETLEAVRIAGLELVDTPEVSPPSRRMKPQVGKQLSALADAKQSLIDYRVLPNGDLTVAYGAARGTTHRNCVVDKSGSAHCQDLKAVSPTLSNASFTPLGTPLALLGRAENDDGSTNEVGYLIPGAKQAKVRAGLVSGFALEQRVGQPFVVKIENGEVVAQQELEDLSYSQFPTVFQDWLGWFDTEESEGEDGEKSERRVLRWQKLDKEAKLVGEPTTLDGEVPPRVDLCFAEKGGAVYGRSNGKLVVWFLSDKGWSKPVSAELPAARRQWGPDCRDGRLERTWVKDDLSRELGSLVCTPAECKISSVKLESAALGIWRRVALLGDKTLALYEAKTDDLRLRVGPTKELGKTTPTIVADSFEYSGPKIEHPRVLLARDFALLHFDDEEDHHGIVLIPDGSAIAVTVK